MLVERVPFAKPLFAMVCFVKVVFARQLFARVLVVMAREKQQGVQFLEAASEKETLLQARELAAMKKETSHPNWRRLPACSSAALVYVG